MNFKGLHKAGAVTVLLGATALTMPAYALDSDAAEAAIGGGLGGALGAVIGNEIGGESGAILGSVIGAAGGTAIIMDDADHDYDYRGHGRHKRHWDRGWHGQRWHRGWDNDDWDEWEEDD